ncbi:MAG: hypothetical protein H7A33_00460 [Deltaproteobacteria bacterium]|nr:hypothetical protein [Deltaproteobacteria bacterium]
MSSNSIEIRYPEVDRYIQNQIEVFEKEVRFGKSSDKSTSVDQFLSDAMAEIDQIVVDQGMTQNNPIDRHSAKGAAQNLNLTQEYLEDSYREIASDLDRRSFVTTAQVAGFLELYGRYKSLVWNTCTDPREESTPPSVRMEGVLEGEGNCRVFEAYGKNIQDRVDVIGGKVRYPANNRRLMLRLGAGAASLAESQSQEARSDLNYLQGKGSLRYLMPTAKPEQKNSLKKDWAIYVEPEWSWFSGSAATLASQQNLFTASIGGARYFGPHFSVGSDIGAGVGLNKINFGEGYVPQKSTSGVFKVDADATLTLPISGLEFMGFTVEGSYQNSFAGDPAYDVVSVQGGIVFSLFKEER